jgi:hypothetical protein
VLQFELLTAVLDLLEKLPWGSGRFLPIIPTDAEYQQLLWFLVELLQRRLGAGMGSSYPLASK